MKVTPLVVAIGIVVVLVLAGGITSGLILARDQAPSPTRQAADPRPVTAATPEPTLAPPATTEPEHLVMAEPGPKSSPDTQAGRSGQETEGPKETLPSTEGEDPGKVYTWHDGDTTRKVVLQPPQDTEMEALAGMAEDGASRDGASTDSVSEKENFESFIGKQPETEEGQPVFRSESGGELMTLPGGIILALDPEWDPAAVEQFFSDNGISMDRTSELDFLDNGFLVETEPGFPSLELANALAGLDGVILSSPNWAREVELK